MNRTLFLGRPSIIVFADVAQFCARTSRILLCLMGILLAASPLTQSLWDGDHFLHGGQDVESGLFAILISLCLMLVLSLRCKQSVNLLFVAWRLVLFIFHDRDLARTASVEVFSVFHAERVSGQLLGIFNFPLQV